MKKPAALSFIAMGVVSVLIGIFAGWVAGVAAFLILQVLASLSGLYIMGTMSLGPWGHLAVNRVRKTYDAATRKGEVVFYGPSNFTYWKEMDQDLLPYRVQNHGIGGTTDAVMMKFAQELVFDYEPRAVFFQTGSNDYAMGCTVEQVKENKKRMYAMFRENLPEAKLCVMAGLFIPARPQYWPQVQEVNEFLEEYCSHYENMIYIDGNAPLRNADGSAKEEFYRPDKLHLNHEGELQWAISMRPVLEQIDAPRVDTK